MDTYGDLRSLLHRPDPAGWTAIRSALEAFASCQELLDVVVPYCQRHLVGWPETLTRAPLPHWSWGWQLASRSVEERLMAMAKLSLCNGGVELRGLGISASAWRHHRLRLSCCALAINGPLNAASIAWLAEHQAPALRRLELLEIEPQPEALGALRRLGWWSTVDSLHLGHPELVAALLGLEMPALSRLRIVQCQPPSGLLLRWVTELSEQVGSPFVLEILGADYAPDDRANLVLLERLPRLDSIRLVDDPFEGGGLEGLQDALGDLHVFSGDD